MRFAHLIQHHSTKVGNVDQDMVEQCWTCWTHFGTQCMNRVFNGYKPTASGVTFSFVPPLKFLVQAAQHCHPHCRQVWKVFRIVVACVCLQHFGHERMSTETWWSRISTVVLHHAATCSMTSYTLCKPAPTNVYVFSILSRSSKMHSRIYIEDMHIQ